MQILESRTDTRAAFPPYGRAALSKQRNQDKINPVRSFLTAIAKYTNKVKNYQSFIGGCGD